MINCPHCGATLLLKAQVSVAKLPAEIEGSPSAKGRFNLTAKQAQVVDLMIAGKTSAEVAKEIGTTAQVVRNRMKDIYTKIGCADRAEMVRIVLLGR